MSQDVCLKGEERVDDLQNSGLRIIQNPAEFCFGMDAVLLASFVQIRAGGQAVDLCTGSGIIPLLLSARTEARRIEGVEIQPQVADMARRSVALNGLEGLISIHTLDLKEAPARLGRDFADSVTCNPPYGRAGASLHSLSEAKRIARHEVRCTLEDCIAAAAALLKHGGRAAFIHQSTRAVDLIALLRQYKLEPKRIRAVQPDRDRPPNLVLVEGVKGGGPGCTWLPSLIVRGEDGEYTSEMRRIYHMD